MISRPFRLLHKFTFIFSIKRTDTSMGIIIHLNESNTAHLLPVGSNKITPKGPGSAVITGRF